MKWLVGALALLSLFLVVSCVDFPKPSNYKWAVKVKGDPEMVAEESGFENLGPVGTLKDIYLFQMKEHLRSTRSTVEKHEALLQGHKEIEWAEEQVPRRMIPR